MPTRTKKSKKIRRTRRGGKNKEWSATNYATYPFLGLPRNVIYGTTNQVHGVASGINSYFGSPISSGLNKSGITNTAKYLYNTGKQKAKNFNKAFSMTPRWSAHEYFYPETHAKINTAYNSVSTLHNEAQQIINRENKEFASRLHNHDSPERAAALDIEQLERLIHTDTITLNKLTSKFEHANSEKKHSLSIKIASLESDIEENEKKLGYLLLKQQQNEEPETDNDVLASVGFKGPLSYGSVYDILDVLNNSNTMNRSKRVKVASVLRKKLLSKQNITNEDKVIIDEIVKSLDEILKHYNN